MATSAAPRGALSKLVPSSPRDRSFTVPDTIQEAVDEYIDSVMSQRHTDPMSDDDETDVDERSRNGDAQLGDASDDVDEHARRRLEGLWRGLTARMAADPKTPTKRRSRSSESVDALRRAAARLALARPGARSKRQARADRLCPQVGRRQASAQKLDGELDINAGAWLAASRSPNHRTFKPSRRSSSEAYSSECETPRGSLVGLKLQDSDSTASMASSLTSSERTTGASSAKARSGKSPHSGAARTDPSPGSSSSSKGSSRSNSAATGRAVPSLFRSRKSHRPATAFAPTPSGGRAIDC